ncbi:MAG: hypothetical protein IJ608_12385 [Lachnospiraceae bacterium]|nr:hypothetical protein [Lachnospiraceae bacterium]
MWYVVQTQSGEEQNLKLYFESLKSQNLSADCFIPLYEEVRRSGGRSRILLKRLFPGYIFVETGAPEEISKILKKIPKFTKLLGVDKDDNDMFMPINSEEEAFLRTLLEDGCMRLSYIRMRNRRVDHIRGPLAKYGNHIAKLDIPHRRAIVEADIFGKHHKIRFGLWLEEDPEITEIKHLLADKDGESCEEEHLLEDIDIGVKCGDIVKDDTGIYEDMVFKVIRVDVQRRLLYTESEMFGTKVRFEMRADDVSVL